MTADNVTLSFNRDAIGVLPAGWQAGVTGSGSPLWSVEADAISSASARVLKQSGSGTFPWCVRTDAAFADGMVAVRFKALAGSRDQAGGVIWRFQDGDNYYVARANALEDNVSLYYTQNGRRNTLKYVDAPVPGNVWHDLRVEFAGRRIRVLFNGTPYIEMDDAHIAGAGVVGVWTKADSVSVFDHFTYRADR